MTTPIRRQRPARASTLVPLSACVLALVSGCALLTGSRSPAPHSESATRLAAAPYRVASAHVRFHDRGRGRTLASTIWWPVDMAGSAPLVIQAHGFLANRSGGTYVARHLASLGYVVAAATHPNTTLFARGGPKVADVLRQPGDVSFLIDRLLADDGRTPRHPPIDPARIAVMGHSLGGLTATLTAFHPRLRDPRIAAAIAIAGPMAMLEPRFFTTAPVPFLMIAGTGDVIVDYRRNALATLALVPGSTLVSIDGASHGGFDDAMTGLPRLLDNPDRLACWVLDRTLHLDATVAELRASALPDDGIDLEHGIARPCLQAPPPVVMRAARQQMITTLAVTAFLESVFARAPGIRVRARDYLMTGLPRDFADVAVASGDAGSGLSPRQAGTAD